MDHADQWWKRAQYALELSRDDDQLMKGTAVEIFQALVPMQEPAKADLKVRRATKKANRGHWEIRDVEAAEIRNVLNALTIEGSNLPEDFLMTNEAGLGSMEEQEEGEVQGT